MNKQIIESIGNIMKQQNLDSAINSDNLDDRIYSAGHPETGKLNLDKGIHDKDFRVRAAVAKNPSSEEYHREIARTEGGYVKFMLMRNPTASEEDIVSGLGDSDKMIHDEAMLHPKYKKYFPNGHYITNSGSVMKY